MNAQKIKIEIWSDIMCPFCYIGKRRLEQALEIFPHKDYVSIEWRSFQLNPHLQNQPGKDIYTYVAELKGMSRERSVDIHRGLVQTAKDMGLDYRFDLAKIANSFDAHRILQLSKKHNLADKTEERLFQAYFTEGALISDPETLLRLASEAGLDPLEVRKVLESDLYADEVRADCNEADHLGATGVPFFVFNRRYAIAGAQPTEYFSRVLLKAYAE